MIRRDLLQGKIAENGMSQAKVAAQLGITPKTFYAKMKRGVFDSNEIEAMIHLLRIQNPTEIFFAKSVAC